jgi:hypothetical protein
MAKIAEAIVVKQPAHLSSLNDIWGNTIGLGLSTSNSNLIGINSNNFKYWIECRVIDYDGNGNSLGVFTTPPRPPDMSGLIDGYGALSISSILRSYLNTKLIIPYGNSILDSSPQPSPMEPIPFFTGPIVSYQIDYGFQYNPNLELEAIIVNFGGNDLLGFTSSQLNIFKPGSTIGIISDNPEISGNFTIDAGTVGSYSFATTTPYTASMGVGTNLASMNFYRQNDGNTEDLYGFDAVFDYEYFPLLGNLVGSIDNHQNFANNYILDGSSPQYPLRPKFLSNYPNWGSSICDWDFFGNPNGFSPTGSIEQSQCFSKSKRMRVNSYETLSLIVDIPSLNTLTYSINYNFYDSSYNLIGTASSIFDINLAPGYGTYPYNLIKWDVAIGFGNLSESGLLTNTSSTDYIVTWITNSEKTNTYSEARYFYIDRTCSIYEPVRVVFKNRLGSWEYFTFTQDQKKTHRITRNQYKKQLNWGEVEGQSENFWYIGNVRGNRVISNKIEEEFTLNSNWISEIEYNWLSELVESTDVYIVVENPGLYPDDKPWFPIIITDTSYEFKTFNRDQIFNLTINYKMAYDKPTQMI